MSEPKYPIGTIFQADWSEKINIRVFDYTPSGIYGVVSQGGSVMGASEWHLDNWAESGSYIVKKPKVKHVHKWVNTGTKLVFCSICNADGTLENL